MFSLFVSHQCHQSVTSSSWWRAQAGEGFLSREQRFDLTAPCSKKQGGALLLWCLVGVCLWHWRWLAALMLLCAGAIRTIDSMCRRALRHHQRPGSKSDRARAAADQKCPATEPDHDTGHPAPAEEPGDADFEHRRPR